MNIDDFLNSQVSFVKQLLQDETGAFYELGFYKNIENTDLRYVFAGLQRELNGLLSFMNDKSEVRGIGHFNADPSRELIQVIGIYTDMEYFLKDTKYKFSIDADYEKCIKKCDSFLSKSGGSDIPKDYTKLKINKYAPIFTLVDSISINKEGCKQSESLQMIGSGSYANVYKYKDTFYNRSFAVKRLKKESKDDEVQRFRDEFKILSKMHSPYILNVYHYDEIEHQYIMELADFTLLDYIEKNPSLPKKARLSIAFQILAGLKYLHNEGLLHRDIAFNNILIFEYDETLVVKISDLGLVKFPESNLTRTNTEIKGSLADPSLREDGFNNYIMCHEIYAMTSLLYFVMTNKKTLTDFANSSVERFVRQGTNIDKSLRFQSDDEILQAFKTTNW